MMGTRLLLRLLVIMALAGITGGILELVGPDVVAQEKKKEKDPQEGKKGTVIGTLTNKGENFIEVQAAGEEKARKYFPQWVGGAPAKGGGFDKNTIKAIREVTVGSRVEIEWLFQERLRVTNLKVLKTATKEKDSESK